ncbi:MAG: hypothetical protein HC886_13385 [Leptolyngbyaceae cyanobacterium SM1_1_3]|nr:hypothetical protein [Leptolyngbyaceae cyanobacterium SM1_1_3]NJN01638.1 hypothetical protein [Leptolyngbyaceae cyanobacterium RM1_1_2]NJO10581.1 hypothetical protein [Leptolyngbyaceae cyanobacterium SL_1_1]
MERGLLWLPLLLVFIGLGWAGWNEYQKLEAYNVWASQFDKSKYDIYAVLGQQGSTLTWGKPTRNGPVNLDSFSLREVGTLTLQVNQKIIDLENPPHQADRPVLAFQLGDRQVNIPFTDLDLATQWLQYLQKQIDAL